MRISRRTIPFLAAAGAAFIALAPQAADAPTEAAAYVNPGDIKWEKAPPSLPKGAKVAVLHGDPGKPGPSLRSG